MYMSKCARQRSQVAAARPSLALVPLARDASACTLKLKLAPSDAALRASTTRFQQPATQTPGDSTCKQKKSQSDAYLSVVARASLGLLLHSYRLARDTPTRVYKLAHADAVAGANVEHVCGVLQVLDAEDMGIDEVDDVDEVADASPIARRVRGACTVGERLIELRRSVG